MESTCIIYGCVQQTRTRRLCLDHYLRGVTAGLSSRQAPVKVCDVEGCSRPRESSDWCAAHKQRYLAYGTPTGGTGTVRQIDWPGCRIDDCQRPARTARGSICKVHQEAYRRIGEPLPANGQGGWKPVTERTCEIIGCKNSCRYLGLCGKHYQRKRIHGDPNVEPLRQKGVRKPDNYVYVTVMDEDGTTRQVPEHRLVMEDLIGRPLVGKENVHHKNGDRHDNRADNLELWNCQQPFGQRIEDKVNFAVEILQLYAPHMLA